jgi:hypothetical protein
MVIEAAWQTDTATRNELEEERARDKHRAPSGAFLQQARFAVALQRLMRDRNISHVHATSSRTLLCGVMLKKLLGVTLSATIETNLELPAAVVQSALEKCEGGRVSNAKLHSRLSSTFLRERGGANRLVSTSVRKLRQLGRCGHHRTCEAVAGWAELLVRWR